MKAVIFTRVSSVGQEDGVSLDAQAAKLIEYCKEKKFEILKTFRIVESSTRGERKEFHKALALIEKQKTLTVLVVHSIDRMLRGFKEYGLIETLISEGKLEIHSYNERLILNKNTPWTEQVQFDFSILGAKMYVAQLRQHVNKSIEYKLSKGEVIGNVPIGYLNRRDVDTKKATVILDDQRAFSVKRMFQEYATGTVSMGELVKITTAWGLTAPRTGKPLSKPAIANILKNPYYYGEMMVRGKAYPHVYPKLIDKSLFDRCQRVIEVSSSNSKTTAEQQVKQRAKKPFIFRGLMRCAQCGCQICSDIKREKYIYLFCTKAKGKELCNSGRIREEVALEAVEDALSRINIPESLIKAIHEHLKIQYDTERSGIKAMVQQLHKQFVEAETRLDRLLDVFLDGGITQNAYDKKRLQLETEKQTINQQLVEYSLDDSDFRESFITLLQVVSKAASLFKSSKVERKRKILSLVFSNIWLDGKNVRYELNKPFDKLANLGGCKEWWAIRDSNTGPHPYQGCALAN
jgi:site-specific DNA recombinase